MKYFGTDGIRGIPNQKLTVDLVTKLGAALKVLGNDIVLATDTRISKDMLASAITAGALSEGLNVEFLGIIPTPALIYYSYKHKKTGVMITASHNPYTDNGIKVLDMGLKLSEDKELLIENLIDNPDSKADVIGKYIINNNAKNEYIDFIKNQIISTDLKIVIDCANGATYQTGEEIFKEITPNLIVISNKPDGYNINNNCGSTHLDLIKKNVVLNKADIGFAFDGDGDRVLAIDKNGNTIDGDLLIYILARYLKENNKLKNNKIALSMMSNLGIIKSLKEYGIDVIETNVGDKYIVKALYDNDLSVGGENSGHIILKDLFHTGDGVFIASQIIKVLVETKKDILDFISDINMYADKMVNIKVKDKSKVLNNKELFNKVEEIKKELNNDCKIIIRASGTEDLIRVSVMAKDNDIVNKYSDLLVNIVNNI